MPKALLEYFNLKKFIAKTLQMIEFLIEYQLPFIVVLTKADKLGKTKKCQMLEIICQHLV